LVIPSTVDVQPKKAAMSDATTPKTKTKVERPRLYKVILLNDDYTPREFAVVALKAEFRITGELAHRIMMTADQKSAWVMVAFTKGVAESRAKRATDMAQKKGYPLMFSIEPEE
jgi:ATP-dependent Clp protease adaptor protein ClpS